MGEQAPRGGGAHPWNVRLALTPRHLWLLLGVTETDESEYLVRKRGRSCETKWFDRIAPRARPTAYGLSKGVSGFTNRIGADLNDLLHLSRNGYVYSTTRGLAVVEYFRSLYPELRLKNGAKFNCHQPLEVAGFMTVPNLSWRGWKD
ncbi:MULTISPECIES: hypothetical protein [unclassified Variovorax]|uniref:hypothetical protein n=1 Tax=unclassified Variovorax TaxID=663243 RepID=UPI00022A684E|nr:MULTISPECIES: hypothetical protein [unclassified Variovorax]AEO20110.1 hypothetical protein VASRS_31 [Variovorax sp. SRS16]VTU42739.1 hypothetical protein SRS16P1_00345 [Variovorax sp. SRS16]VTU42764.1 hypothetical protein E5P1_00343 [Variovorax sp. PBL-E5]VTU43798.1 hypothetical protein H6P1_00585 [Variovorax sp. PBL-H6]